MGVRKIDIRVRRKQKRLGKKERKDHSCKEGERKEGKERERARAREGRCSGRARETGKRETAEMLLTLLEHI